MTAIGLGLALSVDTAEMQNVKGGITTIRRFSVAFLDGNTSAVASVITSIISACEASTQTRPNFVLIPKNEGESSQKEYLGKTNSFLMVYRIVHEVLFGKEHQCCRIGNNINNLSMRSKHTDKSKFCVNP